MFDFFLNSNEIYKCFTVLASIGAFLILVFKLYLIFRDIYHRRYGLYHTWPMMPGGHAITVDELKKLQLKYKKEEKGSVVKKHISNGNPEVQWTVDQIYED